MSASPKIIVVGTGAAGIAAAVTAARSGARVVVIDSASQIGGTGGTSGLTTLCGLFDDAGRWMGGGFAREFSESIAAAPQQQMGRVWVLPYRPQKFRAHAAGLLAGISTRLSTPVANVEIRDGRITKLNGIETDAVIDCSGAAEVARMAGVPCMETDDATQSPAVVISLAGVTRDFKTAADMAAVLLPLARAGFPPVNFQPSVDAGQITVKFSGTPEQAAELVSFLHQNVAGFETCSTPENVFRRSHRAGRMIIGRYVLTGVDVLEARKFPDAVARCCWPIEQWDASGVCRYRYPPAGDYYEIPARCLRAANVENLFMAGKTISADVDAIASTRVMGCCLATGEAAAKLAVASLRREAA